MSFLEQTEGIWEYCRENWMLLVAAGLVIMILVLSAWLIRLSRRDPGEDEDAASEGETPVEASLADEQSPAEIMSSSEPKPSSGTESSSEPESENLPELKPERLSDAEAEKPSEEEMEKPSEEELEKLSEPETEGRPEGTGPEPETAAVHGLVEQLIQNVEKTGGAVSQKVESIELKIEKAQLTIHYADADDEKIKKEGLPEAGEEAKDVERKDAEKKDAGNVDFEGEKAEPAEKDEAEGTADEPSEKTAVRRFGPDNRNRTRSGRIFTEEELRVQIRE